MRVLVTGSRGKVGAAATHALLVAGHDVTAADLGPPAYERDLPGQAPYVRAQLTDAGEAWAVVRDHDVVVHAAAIPDPLHEAPHVVFGNNILAAFNVIQACQAFGVRHLVNISSETVPGFVFDDDAAADYVPVDEEHPARPNDPYAQAKWFVEQLCDRFVAADPSRSAVSIRPTWVTHAGNAERNLGPLVRDPSLPSANYWSYVDVHDLADLIVLAVEAGGLEGRHEVVYAAQPDNCTGRPLADLVALLPEDARPAVREVDRADASGISIAKARRLFGWDPQRSWRDHLDDDGRHRAG